MNCPICNIPLVKAKRLGKAVRLCPECRGEWVPQELMDRLTSVTSSRDPAEPAIAQVPRADAPEEIRSDLFNWF